MPPSVFTFIFREDNMIDLNHYSWEFYGWTGPGKPPRVWLRKRKFVKGGERCIEFGWRVGMRLHAIVVWR